MAKHTISNDTIYQALGIKLPEAYLSFLSQHTKETDDDPSNHCCWKSGFGSLNFVVGTTEAFRANLPNFPKNLVVIGYAGSKKVVMDHQETEVDLFVALDATTSEVFFVDTFGKVEKVGDTFDAWIQTFISWISEHPPEKKSFWDLFRRKGGAVEDGR